MNRTVLILSLILLVSGFGWASDKPNVIVVLADDIGVGDISHYRRMHSGNIILETPNLDSLAESGMVFTQAHSPAALCAPSRYGIMTGNHCYRSRAPWGVWGSYEESPIKDTDLTLGRLMKQAGYTTAFFGKWHLGGDFYRKSAPGTIYRAPRVQPELDIDITKMVDGPAQKGFDYSITFPAGIQDVPYAVFKDSLWLPLHDSSEIGHITQAKMDLIGVTLDKDEGLGDTYWDPHDMGPFLAYKAVDYINAHANKEEPFFMYYCSQAVHLPHTPPDTLDGNNISGTTPSKHMDMIRELDVQMGMLVETLKTQGIYENTIFIFTSDNGGLLRSTTLDSGHKPSSIYRGGKNSRFEGGHRVPFIVSWPDSIKPGQTSDEPVIGLDVMATLAAITNTKIEAGKALDSYNLLPILINENDAKSHPWLMLQGGTGKELIIIEDGWKLIIQTDNTFRMREPIALYDLNTNPQEKEELNYIESKYHQDMVDSLLRKYNWTRDSKIATKNYENIHIPYNHEHIYYEGRIGSDTALEASEVWWPGSSLAIRFIGDSISATIEDQNGENYFNVIVDGSPAKVLHLEKGKKSYVLASNLEHGEHTVELNKRNDWTYGWTRFYGFDLRGINTYPTESKELFIEFYGNSITTGYGNEDYTGEDKPTGDVTNNYNAYGAMTARNLGAEYSCISHSGIGVMVSWFDIIMPEEYYRFNPFDAGSRWDFESKQADVVVVNLLQNDSWIVEEPDNEQFIKRFGTTAPTGNQIVKAYIDFVSLIRDEYPKAQIICLLGNMDITHPDSYWPGYICEAKAALGDKAHSLIVPYKDSPGHPKVEEQKIIADMLTEQIEYILDTVHTLTMYISDEYSGEPLEGVSISIDGKNITSNFEGRINYTITTGDYPVNVSYDRFREKNLYLDISQDTVIYVTLDQTQAKSKFVVRMDSTGLYGATVTIDGQSEATNAVGVVSFSNLKTDTAYIYKIVYQSKLLVEDTVLFNTDTTISFDFTSSVYTGPIFKNGLRVYPNPVSGSLRIKGIEDNYSFVITDINGKVIHSGFGQVGGLVDVSGLANGLYFIKAGRYPPLKFTLLRN